MKKRIMTLFIILSLITITGCGKVNPKEKPENNDSEVNYIEITTSVMNKYYKNIFDIHSNSFCGKVDYNDIKNDAVRVKNYNSISEINKFFNTFLSTRFVNELDDKFVEIDENLYCKAKQMAGLEYNPNTLKITILNKDKSKIEAKTEYKTQANELNSEMTFNGTATLIKENGNWVLDTYSE